MIKDEKQNLVNQDGSLKSEDLNVLKDVIADTMTVGEATPMTVGRPIVNPGVVPNVLPDIDPFALENMILLSVRQNQVVLNRKEVLQALQHCFAPDLVRVPVQNISFGNSGAASHYLNGTAISSIFNDYDPSQLDTQLGIDNAFVDTTGKPLSDDHVPILGWYLSVRQLDIRYAPAVVSVTAMIASAQGHSISDGAEEVFSAQVQLDQISKEGRFVILPVGNGGVYEVQGSVSIPQSASAEDPISLKLDPTEREGSLQVGVPLNDPAFNSLNDSIQRFFFRITGENAQVFVKPIFPTSEVLRALGRVIIKGEAQDYLTTMLDVYGR